MENEGVRPFGIGAFLGIFIGVNLTNSFGFVWSFFGGIIGCFIGSEIEYQYMKLKKK